MSVSRRALVLAVAVPLALAASRAGAQASDTASAGASAAADAGRLDIHGYLTQAYAVSDGTPFYGIRGSGSTDFRYAALQFRYDRNQDGFLIQLNNRRLGKSPITAGEADVRLNWAFYERRTKDGNSSVRVGRVPVPRGIYNEQRNIGVLLPFYRAPIIFYDEGAYYSETIDGAVASHSFRKDEPWSVDANVYGGGWSLNSYDQSGDEFTVSRVRAEDAIGTQLWLNTPVEGVRIGGAYQRYRWESIDPELALSTGHQRVYEVQGSLDATFSRAFFRAESELQHYETDHYYANYVQVGTRVIGGLSINGEAEYAYERAWNAGTYPENFDWHRAAGVSVNYAFSPSLVLKAEHHWNKGIQVEEPATPLAPPRFTYSIVSLSAAF